MDNNNLTQKQDYLSIQILDQGYDPQQFQQYMMTKSNKQLDLNLWMFQELVQVVKQFQLSKNSKNSSNKEGISKSNSIKSNQSQGKEKNKGKQINNISKNMNMHKEDNDGDKSDDQRSSNSNDDHNKQHTKQQKHKQQQQLITQLKKPNNNTDPLSSMSSSQHPLNSVNSSLYKHFTLTSKKTLPQLYAFVHLQHKPITISIASYTKAIPNNIFKSQYIQYQIKTTINNNQKQKWQARRRYTDFIWLQEYLRDKYKGLPVPPIPEKTTIRSFDQKHVDYRMMMLERFLDTCVRIPQICSDPVLQLFLRGNQQYYRQMKKKYQQKLQQSTNSLTPPPVLESIYGQQLLLMDQHTIPVHISQFYKQYSSKLSTLSSYLNILMQDMKKVQSDLNIISSCYQQISTFIQPTVKYAGITQVLHQFVTNFAENVRKQSKFLKYNLYQLWNYQTMYVNNLCTSLSKIQKQQNLLADKHKNSFLKISQQGQNTYSNSLQPNKLIKQFQINKQIYRIKLSQIVHEIRRYQKQGMKQLGKVWIDGLRNFIKDGIGQWMISCTDSMMKGMGIIQGRKLMEVEYIGGVRKGSTGNTGNSGQMGNVNVGNMNIKKEQKQGVMK